MLAEVQATYHPGLLRLLRVFWGKTPHDQDCIMLWAACCTCFFGFLLSGEITVPSAKEYDAGSHLSEGDVRLESVTSPTTVQVRIKDSKTDPFRKGVSVYLGKTGNGLCPVTAVAAYMVVRGRSQGLFFRFASGTPLKEKGS